MNTDYHLPVLLEESIQGLDIQPQGIYVDVTFGGGGHSSEILKALGRDGRLIGFDQDADALQNVLGDDRLTIQPHNFRYLKKYLRLDGITQVDGILADLGVSSFQINTPERGFSFRFDADLDMRMDKKGKKDAASIINKYRVEDLQAVLGRYGEVRNAKSLAQAIVEARRKAPIKTTAKFLDIIGPWIRGDRNRYLAQVFQALRIEVNDEMGALEDFFKDAIDVLAPGGKLVVISYHSLEDRMTKNFMKTGNAEGKVEKDF
ncbi:MAG TPA: 16S rRNA (cytosine(1402)-N(4))-methyltransferase RsmH, partial [Saprospiraceae bacterium]|nr:16S rRNA (cytosine(1402)-N(4))-methyltransferase RsmH [Saprospiraceae bacterium]